MRLRTMPKVFAHSRSGGGTLLASPARGPGRPREDSDPAYRSRAGDRAGPVQAEPGYAWPRTLPPPGPARHFAQAKCRSASPASAPWRESASVTRALRLVACVAPLCRLASSTRRTAAAMAITTTTTSAETEAATGGPSLTAGSGRGPRAKADPAKAKVLVAAATSAHLPARAPGHLRRRGGMASVLRDSPARPARS